MYPTCVSSKLCEFIWSFQVIFLHLWFSRTSYIVLVCISSLWAEFLQNCSSEFAKWSLELSQQSPYWLGGSYWGGRLRRKPLKVATPTHLPSQSDDAMPLLATKHQHNSHQHVSLWSENQYFNRLDIVLGWLLIVAGLVWVAAKIAQVLCIFGKLPPPRLFCLSFLIVARRGFVNQSGGKLDLHYSKVD